jgi:hypothetical protein
MRVELRHSVREHQAQNGTSLWEVDVDDLIPSRNFRRVHYREARGWPARRLHNWRGESGPANDTIVVFLFIHRDYDVDPYPPEWPM